MDVDSALASAVCFHSCVLYLCLSYSYFLASSSIFIQDLKIHSILQRLNNIYHPGTIRFHVHIPNTAAWHSCHTFLLFQVSDLFHFGMTSMQRSCRNPVNLDTAFRFPGPF